MTRIALRPAARARSDVAVVHKIRRGVIPIEILTKQIRPASGHDREHTTGMVQLDTKDEGGNP
jgi:hypothetical protein